MKLLINLSSANAIMIGKTLLLTLILGFVMAARAAIGEESEQPTYDSLGLRDPFVPLVKDGRIIGAPEPVTVQVQQRLVPVLYGILWDPGGNSVALINDGEFQKGDTIGDYQVTGIRKDAVILRSSSEEIVLTINFQSSSAPSR